jgi:hypothetical protein
MRLWQIRHMNNREIQRKEEWGFSYEYLEATQR